MREIGRAAMGFYPTPPRVVDRIAGLFRLPNAPVTCLDAGCADGFVLDRLRRCWLKDNPGANIKLYGVELDKDRAASAAEKFEPTGGNVLCGAIENVSTGGASLLYFNPPYDNVRGMGRMEEELFAAVVGWAGKGNILVMVVPDYVLCSDEYGLAKVVEKHYEFMGGWSFPDPEYQAFKQCVYVGRRRKAKIEAYWIEYPGWAKRGMNRGWPELPAGRKPPFELPAANHNINLHYEHLPEEILLEVAEKSTVRSVLLREAIAPAVKVEHPLLPLRTGHLALALAGGLCDGIVDKNGRRFIVKGTLHREVKHMSTEEKKDEDGRVKAIVDKDRVVYAMRIRCLLESGTIEEYNSHDTDEVEEGQEGGTEAGSEAGGNGREKKGEPPCAERSSHRIGRAIQRELSKRHRRT